MPLTNTSDHMCYFRHALALDERRVKFLPECIFPLMDEDTGVHGGGRSSMKKQWAIEKTNEEVQANYDENENYSAPSVAASNIEHKSELPPHVKEVWFAGCHSDMCVVWAARSST